VRAAYEPRRLGNRPATKAVTGIGECSPVRGMKALFDWPLGLPIADGLPRKGRAMSTMTGLSSPSQPSRSVQDVTGHVRVLHHYSSESSRHSGGRSDATHCRFTAPQSL
jgi:hypothetical protein